MKIMIFEDDYSEAVICKDVFIQFKLTNVARTIPVDIDGKLIHKIKYALIFEVDRNNIMIKKATNKKNAINIKQKLMEVFQ